MSREPIQTRVDGETEAAIQAYADANDLSRGDAIRMMLRTGLANRDDDGPIDTSERDRDRQVLEQRQLDIADRQRQIIRFQRIAVFGGIGWAVVTLATGATGPVWAALGMLAIVFMATSTYIWEYVPSFD